MVIWMFCKKCGAALPSEGFVCKSCGAMMDIEQIKEQKEHMKNNNNKGVDLLSDKYSPQPIKRNYEKRHEYKFMGVLVILLVLFILIILAIIKVI